jgi:hypothetical protein
VQAIHPGDSEVSAVDKSNIKEPGQLGNVPPMGDPKVVYEVEPDLPTLRQDLRLAKKYDEWLSVVALGYPAVSVPLVFLIPHPYVVLASFALALLAVAVVLYLWVLEVFSSGPAVAVFTAWMFGAVYLQGQAFTGIFLSR